MYLVMTIGLTFALLQSPRLRWFYCWQGPKTSEGRILSLCRPVNGSLPTPNNDNLTTHTKRSTSFLYCDVCTCTCKGKINAMCLLCRNIYLYVYTNVYTLYVIQEQHL